MKTPFFSSLALAATLISLPAAKAVYEPNIVSADAQWVLNLDLNTLRETSLGKELLADAAKFQTDQPNPTGIRMDWNKVFATVGSITAYGTKFSQDPHALDGTLVIQGTNDLRKIVEAYVTQASVSSSERVVAVEGFPFTAYNIGGSEGIFIAFPPEPIVLLSKSKEQLLKAHDVFRGDAPSLKKTPDSLLNTLLQGHRDVFLNAASIIPSGNAFPAGAPQARILQMAQSGGLAIGEFNKRTTAHLQLIASDETMADKLAKILQGFAAMASLAESNDKQLTEFLQSINVKREERRVTLDLSYPSEGLVQMIHGLLEQHTEKAIIPPPKPIAPVLPSIAVAEWNADQDLEGNAPTEGNLVYRTIEHVALKQGSTVQITVHVDKVKPARLDDVEITRDEGGAALKFEAEYMLLQHFHREAFSAASGGKLITTQSPSATARFQFPGEDGSYTIKVRYAGEKDSQTHFTVRVSAPEAASEPAE